MSLRKQEKYFDELVIKKALFKISPHLHPRIINSLRFDPSNGTLTISINEKATKELISMIMQELNSYNPKESKNNLLEISIPQNNIEEFINKIDSQDEYELFLLQVDKEKPLFNIYFDDQLDSEIAKNIDSWNEDKKPVVIKYGEEIIKYFFEDEEWKVLRLGDATEEIFKNLPFTETSYKLMKPNETKELRGRISLKNDYISIARDIKDTTDIFDYQIIEKKPGGAKSGVKLGNTYIKKMHYSKSDLLEYFTYIAFHEFLGTKAPQVEIIKDKKNNLWMLSMGLSQTYIKKGIVKDKKFGTLEKLFSVEKGYSRENPLIGSENIDLKSIAKLMLLSVLFHAKDLHPQNVGTVSNNSINQKLSIVDLQVTEHKLTDFSSAPNFASLLDLLAKEFEIINQGLATMFPVVPKLIEGLKNEESAFLEAIDAILHPLTENKQRNKSLFYTKSGQTFFEGKGETFDEVLQKSYYLALNNFKEIGFDKSCTIFSSYGEKESIEKILFNQMQLILMNFKNLEKTVTSLHARDKLLSNNVKKQ